MKRIFKTFAGLVTVALVCGCAFFFYVVLRSPKLERGEGYTFYLGKSSSARAVSSTSPLIKLFLGETKGESAVYRGDRYEEFARKYRAKLLFTERVGDTVSYYLYSPDMGESVALCGEAVNLQIAVGGGQTAVGTPLIFGGW